MGVFLQSIRLFARVYVGTIEILQYATETGKKEEVVEADSTKNNNSFFCHKEHTL